jgi:hypothetical protein
MSKSNHYRKNRSQHHSQGSDERIEIPATVEMKKLVPTNGIYINHKRDTIFIYDGDDKPAEAPYNGDNPIDTVGGLKQKVIALFEREFQLRNCNPEEVVSEWIGLLSDQIIEQEKEAKDNENEDEDEDKKYYVNKYTPHDGRLLESVIVKGKPYFIQMKKGSDLDFDILRQFSEDNKILKPRGMNALSESYVFESKEDVQYYLKLARHLTANLNFDRIFELVRRIFKQYVVLEDHYITLLVADIIYSYFQDKFGTTHYVMCIGDNESGKNSILLSFGRLGYRVLLATNVSAANVFTFHGSAESCQGTIAEDEVDNLDTPNERDKLNAYKSGYCVGTSKIPKTDLSYGRNQDAFHTYCFKIFASESSLDNSKAKGLLDRSFEIRCLIGRPKYNIKYVDNHDKLNKLLHEDLAQTRKLLFACRMIRHIHDIEDLRLNVFNREEELTKPSIQLFQNSPKVLNGYLDKDGNKITGLLEALTKCLDTKRKLKSTSLEAILYTAICNLVPHHNTIDGSVTIPNQEIEDEMKRITDGEDIPGKQAFFSRDLGTELPYKRITKTLVDKFRAKPDHVGTGNGKRRGLRFTKSDLDSKKLDYDVAVKIEILPYDEDISRQGIFDSIVGGAEDGEDLGNGKASEDNWDAGTENSPSEHVDENADNSNEVQITSDIEHEKGVDTSEKSTIDTAESSHSHISVPTVPASQGARISGTKKTLRLSVPEPENMEDEDEDGPADPPDIQPPRTIDPIASVDEFFSNDIPLDGHSLEQSPCYSIIGSKPGEIPTNTVYYCKLHPDLPSTFINAIENHCRDKEPDIHKAEILRVLAIATTAEREAAQQQHSPSLGEST